MTRSGQAGAPAVGDLLGDLRGVLLEGRYRVDELIAKGGMSWVYAGLDTRLDRPVAIKVMDPRLAADPDFRRRFQREARSAARLDHPGVVDVHDQGTHGDGPAPLVFLVMELVDGGNLRDVLEARRALPVSEAFTVLEAVLAGLASAHRDGLVHRDVKPENVLISGTGAVKVADFGLVTAAAQAAQTGNDGGAGTATGAIMGTPAYLSPEQVAGGTTDARTDVYAAGILLYEMLTGAPPFSGDTALAVAYQHVNGAVPAPSARAPGIPPEVDDLVALATRRDPEARPLDAGDLALAVRRVRAELGLSVTPIPVPPPRQPLDGATEPMNGAGASAGRWGTRQFTQAPGYGAPATVGAPGGAPAVPVAGPGGHRAPIPEPLLRRRRGRRAFAIWLAVVIALGVIVAATAWWLGAGRFVEMPSVIGLDRDSAERVLSDAGLVVSVAERTDDAVAEGTVSATDPAPAVQLPRGSGVTMTISTGRPRVPVIAAGTEVPEAQRLVREAGLTPVASSRLEFSSSVAEGEVLRTEPPAGTRLPSNAPVELVLSAGEEPDRIPPGLGRILEDLGLGNGGNGSGGDNGNGNGNGGGNGNGNGGGNGGGRGRGGGDG